MKRLGLILALSALVAPEMATAQRACITAPEAEAMTLVAMPDILRETGRVCGARLPANSLIRGGGYRFVLPVDLGETVIADDVTRDELRAALAACGISR